MHLHMTYTDMHSYLFVSSVGFDPRSEVRAEWRPGGADSRALHADVILRRLVIEQSHGGVFSRCDVTRLTMLAVFVN